MMYVVFALACDKEDDRTNEFWDLVNDGKFKLIPFDNTMSPLEGKVYDALINGWRTSLKDTSKIEGML